MIKKTNISFTPENIKAYLAGDFSKKEEANFEQLVEGNPFYKDALEGYRSQEESLSAVERLKQNKKFKIKKANNVFYGIGGVFVLLVFFIWLKNPSNQTNNDKNKAENINLPKVFQKDTLEKNNKPQTKEFANKVYKADPKELIEKHILKVSTITKDTDEIALKRKLSYVSIPKKPITPIVLKQDVTIATESIPLVSIYGFIAVDYSKIEKGNHQIKKQTINLQSVPASKENKNSRFEEHQLKTEQINYVEFLSESQKLFLASNFKGALEGYNEILKQYPMDVNASFYSGLCYYNLNNNEKAIHFFDLVETHYYTTFSEEAAWYKAKALVDLGKFAEASVLLEKIIKKEGFYVKKAKVLLGLTDED